jgi:3-phenylpropionate/trans-cinnamate dioxygenase ferredoxin reductase subunit
MGHIIVVGAGQAGCALVAKLRALQCSDEITLIGEEPVPPYQRPPLSKKYLLGKMAVERLFLRPAAFYTDHHVTLRLGTPVSGVDAQAKTLQLGDETLGYDQLVLTTGARPRRLPAAIGGTLKGVHVVRTLADVDRMAGDCVASKRVLIVGGGYIGLEAAAVATQMGLNVVLVEMAERILQRVAAPATSDYFRALHVAHGVDLREGVGLTTLLEDNGRVSGATLTDGSEIACDMVIVGVGVDPATDIAEMAGVAVDNGIAVDARGTTSDPAIWAAGDCANFPYHGARIRLESVQNAIDQAEAVAVNLSGGSEEYLPQPWFWSDQYDVKLQIAGLNTGYDDVIKRQSAGGVSHWYFKGETLVSVDAMNDPRSYMIAKRLIEAGKSPAKAAVIEPQTDLKSLLR